MKVTKEYKNEHILISFTMNGEKINLTSLDKHMVNIMANSEIFRVSSDNRSLMLKYENIYSIDDEYKGIFDLPQYFQGFVKIKKNTYLLNEEGVRFEYVFIHKNYFFLKRYPNIIVRDFDGKRFLLTQKQYELLVTIEDFNNSHKIFIPSEQYRMIELFKKAASLDNVLLSDDINMENSNIEIIDDLIIDFQPIEDNNLEIIPKLKHKSDEFNEKFSEVIRSKNKGLDFYNVSLNNINTTIVLSSSIKKAIDSSAKQKHRIKQEDFLNNVLPDEILENENIEIVYGPRVKGLGYLNYRSNPVSHQSGINWFDLKSPRIFHQEGFIDLHPLNLTSMEQLLNKLKCKDDVGELVFDTDEGVKKIRISKENLEDEIAKLNYSIKNYSDIPNKASLILYLSQLNDFPEEQFVKVGNYYIKREENLRKVEMYLENLTHLEKSRNIALSEKVPLAIDNFDSIGYSENAEHIKEMQEFIRPKSLKQSIELYDYQKQAVSKMLSLYKKNPINGFLLSDDMGLGKTIQILTFMAIIHEKKTIKNSLIVLPSALIRNWIEEIEIFFLYNSFSILTIREKLSISKFNEILKNDITITTYESLRLNQKYFAGVKWKVLVCDEVQRIKNSRAKVTNSVKNQNAEFKIACSATPIENSLLDLWSISDFIKPSLLGSEKEFKQKYIDSKETSIDLINNEFQNKLDCFFLRRMKEDTLGKDFPQKKIVLQKIPLTIIQSRLLKKLQELKNTSSTVLPLIQSMIRVCSHPLLAKEHDTINYFDYESLVKESAKLSSLQSTLKEIQKRNEKVIIFTEYKKMQRIISYIINCCFNFFPQIINGDVSGDERIDIIKSFSNKSGFNAIILSPKAAGVGLNIISANHVIHYSRHWNPAKEDQSTDRVYRIGQKKDVFVYLPIVCCNVDSSSEFIFKNEADYLDSCKNDDTVGKSPEEKLNKIILRKKEMLRNFFFAFTPESSLKELEENFTDFQKEFSDIEINNSSLTIQSIDEMLTSNEFRILCTKLLERKLNGRSYVFLNEANNRFDSVVIANEEYYLVHIIKEELSREYILELLNDKEDFENIIGNKSLNLIIISKIEKREIKNYDIICKKVNIISRTELATLLSDYDIFYSEILEVLEISVMNFMNNFKSVEKIKK
ncbi:MAG: DEAD/DEAH box helicase [Candidatus Cloacimonetes bacterium]|nr:DEAD/DEAH box helicase [Candidatus Cloacimonadota bacterium]